MSSRALIMLGAGFALWALAFVMLYSMQAIGCEFGWQNVELAGRLSLQRAQLVALFLVHLGVAIALALALRRVSNDSFLWWTAYAAALAAAASTAFTYGGVFVLSPCN